MLVHIRYFFAPLSDTPLQAYHSGNTFWDVFKQCLQGGNLQIVCFTSDGYKGALATPGTLVTPCAIPEQNTWGFNDVRFTDDEFEDFVSRFCKSHLHLEDHDSKLLQQYVGNTTGYHPGLVACFMDKINICTDFQLFEFL